MPFCADPNVWSLLPIAPTVTRSNGVALSPSGVIAEVDGNNLRVTSPGKLSFTQVPPDPSLGITPGTARRRRSLLSVAEQEEAGAL